IWGEEIVECLAETGAEILLVPNGSPYWRGKGDEQRALAASQSGKPKRHANRQCTDAINADPGCPVAQHTVDVRIAHRKPGKSSEKACTQELKNAPEPPEAQSCAQVGTYPAPQDSSPIDDIGCSTKERKISTKSKQRSC
ncbi:MAG: hypothetical protein EBV16_13970, partial [Betaproteobacteria bacterium]|nr:hypothetical protein [Betaproteobacteria bacterium]